MDSRSRLPAHRLPAHRLCAPRSLVCTNLGTAPAPRRALGPEAVFDIRVGGVDELAEGRAVQPAPGDQFRVPHAFAAPLEQSRRILEHCPAKKADVDMA